MLEWDINHSLVLGAIPRLAHPWPSSHGPFLVLDCSAPTKGWVCTSWVCKIVKIMIFHGFFHGFFGARYPPKSPNPAPGPVPASSQCFSVPVASRRAGFHGFPGWVQSRRFWRVIQHFPASWPAGQFARSLARSLSICLRLDLSKHACMHGRASERATSGAEAAFSSFLPQKLWLRTCQR